MDCLSIQFMVRIISNVRIFKKYQTTTCSDAEWKSQPNLATNDSVLRCVYRCNMDRVL